VRRGAARKARRALGIYNIGMAFGATAVSCSANVLASKIGWRNVFWIAGGPVDPARGSRGVRGAPDPPRAPGQAPRPGIPPGPTYLIALAGGILSTFGASALVVWSQKLIVGERSCRCRATSSWRRSGSLPASAASSRAATSATVLTRRGGRGGHARAIGLSLIAACRSASRRC
jgi:hypothetical protein